RGVGSGTGIVLGIVFLATCCSGRGAAMVPVVKRVGGRIVVLPNSATSIRGAISRLAFGAGRLAAAAGGFGATGSAGGASTVGADAAGRVATKVTCGAVTTMSG